MRSSRVQRGRMTRHGQAFEGYKAMLEGMGQLLKSMKGQTGSDTQEEASDEHLSRKAKKKKKKKEQRYREAT